MSGSEYFPVGQTITDAFEYYGVTGLGNGDFTKELSKNGTGNQSTTGITISEIDASNNAGLYGISISGSTGFAAAVGEYSLKVYRTSTPSDYWTFTYRVTADGTGNGTYGAAAFTPTASNGRITDGSNPLQCATVRILNSSGIILSQQTTDSDGLWNTIYLANGTYTISADLSGYTQVTGTITVSSGVATGPGTDIELTAVSATSTLLASNLWAYAGRMMLDRNGAKADQEKREAVDDALEYLSLQKQWPFYHQDGQVTVNAAYETGTIAITNGATTVTLTGGTFPTWAASGLLYVDGQSYRISSRDSSTQLTLATAWNQASVSGESYVLAQHSYSLPSNLQRFDQIFYDRAWAWGTKPISHALLESMRQGIQYGQKRASAFSIANGKIHLWPWPTEALTVNLLYFRRPAKLVSGGATADWSDLHEVVLRRAIDYQCALRGECVAGTKAECKRALDEAIDLAFEADQTPVSMDQAGPMWDPSRPFRGHTINA